MDRHTSHAKLAWLERIRRGGVGQGVMRALVCLQMVLAAAASAQDGGTGIARPVDDDLVQSPFEDDPIGIRDDDDLRRLTDRDRAEAAARAAREAEARRGRGPDAPAIAVQDGEALAAISGVRETSHQVGIELADGMARVSTLLRFVNRNTTPAEVRYRLAVPPGASLAALEVCGLPARPQGTPARGSEASTPAPAPAARCRRAVADRFDPATLSAYDEAVTSRGPSGALPVAFARTTRDARGEAIELRAAPVAPHAGELELRVTWLAEAPMHAGVVRFVLPARGSDPRVMPASVHVAALALGAAAVDGTELHAGASVSVEPWQPAEISARVAAPPTARAAPTALFWTAPCDAGTCGRAFVSAPPAPAAPRDLVIAVDASPSTEGPARGRIVPAIVSLLGVAPEGTRVRALAFAARAQPLVAEPVDAAEVRLTSFRDATTLELGSASRFEAAWEAAAPWLGRAGRSSGHRPLLVLVGDGGITGGAGSRAAIAAADRAGVEIAVINLADRTTWPALADLATRTGGALVEAGPEADEAARGRSTARLDERMASVFAPVVARDVTVRAGPARVALGPLRAGESLSWRGPLAAAARAPATGAVQLGGRRIPARPAPDPVRTAMSGAPLLAVEPADLREPHLACGTAGPVFRRGGVSSDAAPIALAGPRACAMPASPPRAATTVGRGMPAETVLGMLRQRVLPIARRCLRADRLGRAQYHARAEFVVHLADREIVAAEVRGQIRPELRHCLASAVDVLDVPRFDGTVVVRYPILAAPEPPPPVLELTPGIAREIDRLFGREPRAP